MDYKCDGCTNKESCLRKEEFMQFESQYNAGTGYGDGFYFRSNPTCSKFVSMIQKAGDIPQRPLFKEDNNDLLETLGNHN